MLHMNSLVFYQSFHCADGSFLDQPTGFYWSAISLQIPFKLLKIQPASCLLSIILWPLSPHLYFWWKPNFRFLPNQGTLLSEKKKKIGLYMHLIKNIWNVHKSSQVRKRKGQLHKDVIAIKELVAKSLG